MVLDGVVCPAWQVLGDFSPLVTILDMLLHQDLIFPACPVPPLDVWVKMVVPPAVHAALVRNDIVLVAACMLEQSVKCGMAVHAALHK